MAFNNTKRIIFKSFLYCLGINYLNTNNYKNRIKVYLTGRSFYTNNKEKFDSVNTLFYDLNRDGCVSTDLKVEDIIVKTVNSDTNMDSEASYEELFNYPASGKIFSTENNNSWVTHDLDWSISAFSGEYGDETRQYFETEYAFSSGYNAEEYNSYNLKERTLEEDVSSIFAADFTLTNEKGNKSAMKNGADGILLTYIEPKAGSFRSGDELPMMYIELPKHMSSNYNYLNIEWNKEGLLKCK